MTKINETWLPVEGFEGFYSVSDQGRIKSLEREVMRKDGKKLPVKEKILKTSKSESGFYQVALYIDGVPTIYSVSRLVLATFCGAPDPTMNVRHRNGDHADNRLANLRWETVSESNLRKWETGQMMCGEGHTNHKLTEQQVILIKKLIPFMAYGAISAMADAMGVSHVSIIKILNGKTWTHVNV